MTYEEALNEINQECVICRTSNNCAKDECIWFICKKAIDKQIPKKLNRTEVVLKTHSYIEPSCPSCGGTDAEIGTEFYGMYEESEWCLTCGQHLDWEEEE